MYRDSRGSLPKLPTHAPREGRVGLMRDQLRYVDLTSPVRPTLEKVNMCVLFLKLAKHAATSISGLGVAASTVLVPMGVIVRCKVLACSISKGDKTAFEAQDL